MLSSQKEELGSEVGRGLGTPHQTCLMGTIKYRQRPPGTEANRRARDLFRGPLASCIGGCSSRQHTNYQFDRACCYPERYGGEGTAGGGGGVARSLQSELGTSSSVAETNMERHISLLCRHVPKTLRHGNPASKPE